MPCNAVTDCHRHRLVLQVLRDGSRLVDNLFCVWRASLRSQWGVQQRDAGPVCTVAVYAASATVPAARDGKAAVA